MISGYLRAGTRVRATALLWAAFIAAVLLTSIVMVLSSRASPDNPLARPHVARDLAGLFPWWLCDEGVLKGCDLPARAAIGLGD
jgi:hypothetical protein